MPQLNKPKISIPYAALDRGDSVFVPCITCEQDAKAYIEEARKLGVYIQIAKSIENDTQGLRVFRIK